MQKEIKNSLYSKFVNELCKKYVKKNFNVFDCGCGDGFHTSIIKKYSTNVVGGDFDNRTKRDYGIAFKKIGVNKYGREKEFNLVTAFDVIEHVENDKEFLREILRILKPGGIAIVGTPNRDRLSNKIISLIKGKIKFPRNLGYHFESGGDIIHLREYTSADLENLVKKTKGAKTIETHCAFIGTYLPKIGSFGLKKLDTKILKNYCQHLFIVFKKI